MTRVPLIGYGLLALLAGWLAYATVQDHRNQQIGRFVYDEVDDVLTVFYRDGAAPQRFKRACHPRYQPWWYVVFPARWPVIEYCQERFDGAQEEAFRRRIAWCDAQGIPVERCTAAAIGLE